LYGKEQFPFQKLEMGLGIDMPELERLETEILVQLEPEKRYNFYTNWRKRGSETNPFFGQQPTEDSREAQCLANSEINSGMSSRDRLVSQRLNLSGAPYLNSSALEFR
jgi:hypothetical protein